MSKIIKGNLEIQGTSFDVNGKQPVLSVNDVPVDNTGNVYIAPTELNITGINGKTVFLGEQTNIIDNSCKLARIADSAVEFENEKKQITPLSEVFNTWKRLSQACTKYGIYPADPSEVNTWSYNATNGTIYNGTNSTTFLGFVSPEVYTKYEFEVQMSSTDQDDDFMGLILAYTEIDGFQYTIYASRKLALQDWDACGINHSADIWTIYYNFNQGPQSQEYKIADGTSFVNKPGGGWNQYPNGVTMKAVRDGDIISVYITNVNSTTLLPTPLIIDLNSDPRLYKFKNPCSIGYGTNSQARSTFKNIRFSGDRNIIYNAMDANVYYYNNTDWINLGTNMYDLLPSGAIYSNPNTNRLFYINNNSTTTAVAGLSVGTGAGQVPSMLNFDFSSSLVGYQRLPNGLMMQWVTVASTGTSATVTLPQPFSTAILSGYCVSSTSAENTLNQYTVNIAGSSISSVNVVGRFLSDTSVTSSGAINCKVIVLGY